MVSEIATSYGHSNRSKVMQGSLRVQLGARCKAIGQGSVSLALRTVAPEAYQARTKDLLQRTNWISYFASFFFLCCFDKNEKLEPYFNCVCD